MPAESSNIVAKSQAPLNQSSSHQNMVDKSDSTKSIIISIISTIIAVLLIALFTGWLSSQKTELKDDIVKSLTLKIDTSNEEIKVKLKEEKKARALLAATLMKSGLDIPTNLVVGFSGIDKDSELKTIFENEFNAGGILTGITFENYENISTEFLSSDFTALGAKIGKNSMLIGYTKDVDKQKFSNEIQVVPVSFSSNAGKEIEVPIKLNETSDFIDILKQDGIKVSDVIVVPLSSASNNDNTNEN